MKKVWYWVFGIILFLGVMGIFTQDEEPTIISNVIKEDNSIELTKELIEENTITSNVVYEGITLEEEVQEEATPEEIVKVIVPKPTNDFYKVTRVIDGDTIELSSGERVRLICIDSPEQGGEGYSEAKSYLESLILNEDVELVKDVSETDRYGRLLRYIYLKDGTFVNERIVYYGYGGAYPYNPDISLCSEIQEAEQHAKQNNLGIWKEISSNSDVICSFNAYNCEDFSSCSEVMDVFNACSNDIHYLDGDDDGIPCESLCG